MNKNKISRGFTKLVSVLLALILVMSLLPARAMAAGFHSLVEELNNEAWLENNAIHVDVSKSSGAFYIRTVAGDKLVKGDEYANLLWPSEDDTSFTSVRITRDGVTKDYIFGKNYGSGNAVTVTNDGTQITAVWTVDSVTVTQAIKLQPSNNDAHGMVVINYSVENSGAPAEISLRVLLDTAMGGKDYAYYNIGNALVETERELGLNGYDKSIYLMDDPSDPLVTGYILNGSVDGAESKPEKTVIAHWANLASSVYEYSPDESLNFTNAFNAQHMTSDSAVALYYGLGSVASGSTANAQFNYGLYSNEKVSGYKVAVNLQTVDALSYTDETESAFVDDGLFTAKTILQNASGTTYAKVRVYAYASGGISVLNADGSPTDENGKTYGYDNPYYVEINDFAPGQKVNNLSDWNFRAVMAAEANYGRIHFKVYDMSANYGNKPLENDLIGEAKKYVLIPGSQEKLPDIQLTGSSPSIFHTEGHRVFNVTGMRFASLEAEVGNTCTLKLSRKDGEEIRDGMQSIELPTAAFTINEDGSGMMSVKIDGDLPQGEYMVTVDYTDAERDDIDAKALEFQVIDDTRYRCESYSFVAIYHDEAADANGHHPKHNYRVMMFEGEDSYNRWRAENGIEETDVLMIFEGVFDDLTNSLPEDAGSLKDGESYSCYLSASVSEDSLNNVTMNDILEFSSQEPGASVVIKEIQKDDKYSIKVDFNCKVSIFGVGTTVYGQCISCFTELKSGTAYKLIEYDDSGERNDSVGDTICLLWPNSNEIQQAVAGAFFNFRYAELGYMETEGGIIRTVGFGGGLDLSCIIPKADDYYTWEEMYPQDENYKVTADEQRAWNEAMDIRNENKSFSQKNKDRADANVANGFYDEDGDFQYTASVQVNDILYGARSFLGFNISVGVGIPSLTYGMPSIEGVFTLRTIGQWEFRVNGSMQFMEFELEALLDMKANKLGLLIPDELKFFIGGITPGVPLDPYGVMWIQGGGGGIKDIYETIYLQDKVPPLKIILQAQFSLMQIMVAKATIEAGLTGFGVALNDVRIKATDIAVLDSAVIAIRWSPNFAFIGSIQVNLKDVIKGGGYMVGYDNYDHSNPFFEAFVLAEISTPESTPIVGGITVGGVQMGIGSERIFGKIETMGIGIGCSYYWRDDFQWGMKNEASPTFPELLGMGQEFDTDIDEMFEDIPTPGDDGNGIGGSEGIPLYYDAENNRTLMTVPGTNFDRSNTVVLRGRVGDPGSDDELQNTLIISPDGKTVEAALADNGKSKILVLTWNSESMDAAASEAASISTGDYALIMMDHDADANGQTNANANLSYNAETKKASLAVTVTNRNVRELHFASSFGMDAVLYDVDALPELSGGSAALNANELTVNLSGSDLDSFDYVNVGLIKQSELEAAAADSEYVPEITLIGRIGKDNGHLTTSFTTALPADLASDSYVVRLMAQDEAQSQISQLDLTESVVSFVNPNTPGDPASIGTVTAAGDWKVNVPIDPGTSDDFDGYKISVTDPDGTPVSGLTDLLFYRNGEFVQYAQDGTVTVPEENLPAEHITIGGHMEVPVSNTASDEEGMTANEESLTDTEILGFQAGEYTVSVRKWKAADGIPVYSGAITKDFSVSAPVPAVLAISGPNRVTRTEQRGEETVEIPYYTSDELLLTLYASRMVTGSWVIDNMSEEPGYHGSFEDPVLNAQIPLAELGLTEGVHSLTFTGKDAVGNVSGISYAFGVDNKAPLLLISSPENGGVFDGATGAVSFTGVTDPGATIELFDKTTGSVLTPSELQIDPDTGDFTATITLSGAASIRQITLTVSDDLGNAGEKNFTLRSSLLSSITCLYLYEGGTDKTEQTLAAGTHTLRLVGMTADGQIVELCDPSMLEWDAQTLEGTAIQASLSEDGTQFIVTAGEDSVGVITGQLLVNGAGSYPVSCMIGSTLSVSTNEITVAVGETAPLGVSSRTGAALTFESADPAIATVSTDSDGIATVTGVNPGVTTVTVTASTGETATVTVTVTGSNEMPPTIYRSISIGAELMTVYTFRAEDLEPFESWYLELQRLDAEGSVMESAYYGDGQANELSLENGIWYAIDTSLSAKEMGVSVRAKLVCFDAEGVRSESEPVEGSIRDYLLELLTTRNGGDPLHTLAADLLNYGAAAQVYFNYDIDHLVNEDLDETQTAAMERYATPGEAPAEKINSTDGPTLYGSISLMNRVVLSLSMMVRDAQGLVTVLVRDPANGAEAQLETTAYNAMIYNALFDEISAENMRKEYQFVTLVDGVEIGNVMTWSVEGYIRELRQSEDEATIALANALLIYGDSAAAYLNP